MPTLGIEPRITDYKTDVLPLTLYGRIYYPLKLYIKESFIALSGKVKKNGYLAKQQKTLFS